MYLLTRVLLRYLELYHNICVLHRAEKRVNGLAYLEIYGAVLYLEYNIVVELSVKVRKALVGSRGAVGILVAPILGAVVHEAAPDNYAAVGLHGAGEHICAVVVVSAVGVGTRFTLGVGFHEEAAEIFHCSEKLFRAVSPPLRHSGVAGVAGIHAADRLWRGKVNAEEKLDTVSFEDLRKGVKALEMLPRDEPLCSAADVNIINDRRVYADGSKRPGVHLGALVHKKLPVLEEEAPSRIAALNAAVDVVPVVIHSKRRGRRDLFGKYRKAAREPYLSQKGKGAVKHARAVAAYYLAAVARAGNAVALPAESLVLRNY